MSMTLILWKAPTVQDADEATKLTEAWYETEDDSAFEPSKDIAKVAAELRRRWPYRQLSNEEAVAHMSEEEREQYSPEALKEIRGVDPKVRLGPICHFGKASGYWRWISAAMRTTKL